MSERELIDGLARLAGPVLPGEDPYGRLMRRHRRSRRTTAAGWATGVVMVIVAALLGPIGIQGAAQPVLGGPSGSSSAQESEDSDVLTPWVRRLIDTPVRGGLAADTAFVDELTDLLQQRDSTVLPDGRVKILFAGDVDDHRVVVAVRADDRSQRGMLLAAERGASPQRLNSTDTRQDTPDERAFFSVRLDPYYRVSVGRTIIGLAPAGCRIAVQDTRVLPLSWVDEPAGDLLLSQRGWAWHRVTCDGKIRFQGPGMGSLGIHQGRAVTEAELAAGLAGARGQVDAGEAVRQLRAAGRAEMSGAPRLLFMGRPPGTDQLVHSVITAPLTGGWWYVASEATGSQGMSFATSADLGRADTVVSVILDFANPGAQAPPTPDGNSDWPVLVVAPPTATTLQVLDEVGRLVETVPLAEGVGTIYQKREVERLLRVLDASGGVVGTGQFPMPTEQSTMLMGVEDWD
ncbi:hypothetical protein [Catellatospora sichuanensis]|uniref:hypothetical protein n=1 Tax=Catellatospora sichuanensis TaxID=1969805 RepID=UPI001183295A|nr:hypothetical protein [Catellatospora sichuanensis]